MTEPDLTDDIHQLLDNITEITFPAIQDAQDQELKSDRTYRLLKGHKDFIINGHKANHNSILLLTEKITHAVKLTSPEFFLIKLPKLEDLKQVAGKQHAIERKHRHIEEQAGREFEHVRVKLRDYPRAIAIDDRTTIEIAGIQATATAQRFIEGTTPLDKWLKSELESKSRQLLSLDEWLNLSESIVDLLREVHSRRVTHGDFYERNILRKDNSLVLIDFADSIHEDDLDRWKKELHVYLAPERASRVNAAPNESSDVYSLGMVLLNLATMKILPKPQSQELADAILQFKLERKERKRRELVRNFLKTHNPSFFTGEKDNVQIAEKIADLIGKCTAYLQADRPTCQEIHDEIRSYRLRIDDTHMLDDCKSRLAGMLEIASNRLSNVPTPFIRVLNRQIQSLEFLINGCDRYAVDIRSSREKLMKEVCDLLDNLSNGDSWTSISLPSVWQDRALGLNDRAFTSCIHAVSRGASLQRGFVLSEQDLGSELWDIWMANLDNKHPVLKGAIDNARGQFASDDDEEKSTQRRQVGNTVSPSSNAVGLHSNLRSGLSRLKQLVRILNGYRNSNLVPQNLCTSQFTSITNCAGLYLGLLPVKECFSVRRIRCTDPFVLIHSQKQWFLLQGFFRERFSMIDDKVEVKLDHEPELVALRLFQSIRASGVPDTRIRTIERKLSLSVNCAANDWELLSSLEQVIEIAKLRLTQNHQKSETSGENT